MSIRRLKFLSANIQAGSSTRGYGDYVARSWSHVLPAGNKRGALREVVGLGGEAGTQAARIGFLQSDDVMRAGQLRDLVERAALVASRQHMRPAARDIVAVSARAGAGLDVGAEELEPAVGHGLRWRPPPRAPSG